jgi:UDP-glucose 4-epimerase
MEPSGGKIAVTGGLGFIGSHLVEELIKRGHDVTVIDSATPTAEQEACGADFIWGDLQQAKEAERVFSRLASAGYQSFIHLAGNANALRSVAEPDLDFSINAGATVNVLISAARSGWRRGVIASSALVYGRSGSTLRPETELPDPIFPYSASKLAAEAFAVALSRCTDLQVVAARLFTVYGPSRNPEKSPAEPVQYAALALRDVPITVQGDPVEKVRDFIHVRDVVDAIGILLERGEGGQIYNVGTGVATSLQSLLNEIGNQLGRPVKWRADSSDLSDSYAIVADVDRISCLGFSPGVLLQDALASALSVGSKS